MSDDETKFFEHLEDAGEPAVRAKLESREWGTRERLVRRWLAEKDAARAHTKDSRDDRNTAAVEAAAEHANRSAAAGEEAAIQAARAADAAERSADAAWRSLIVSIIALGVAVLAAVLSFINHN